MDTATGTVEALARVTDAIDRMTFVHGWAVVAMGIAVAVIFGWKLWKG